MQYKESGVFDHYLPNGAAPIHNFLLKLPVFTVLERQRRAEEVISNHMSFESIEGYTDVRISGVKLSADTDFLCWCQVVLSFEDSSGDSSTIDLNLLDFLKGMGYESKRIDKSLKRRIEGSLDRLSSTSIKFSFTRKNSDSISRVVKYSLLSKYDIDLDRNRLSLTIDESIREVYRSDFASYVFPEKYKKIKTESAKTLFLFLLALPDNLSTLTVERISQRLSLEQKERKDRVKSIIRAGKELKDAGYLLSFEECKSKTDKRKTVGFNFKFSRKSILN